FITLAQGEAGLKFTPNSGSLVPGGFAVQEATTNMTGDISGPAVRAAITVSLAGATVTNATTTINTQTTSGLVITRGTGDTAVNYFFITGITGGTLYQNNGTTAIANNTFITLAQGEAGLKFTPNTGSTVPGGFAVQESTTNMTGDISGPAVRAAITVTLTGATVTNATTTLNTQTTSGLVITPGSGDTAATYFYITGITGGTLYQNNGTTAIANNTFITLAQGEAGLRFTPNSGSLAAGGFTVTEATGNTTSSISGPSSRASIAVTLTGPTVTGATTTANTQTTSGLVITPGAGDTAATYFYVTGISGGTLYQNNGTTQITSGSFITLAQGEAGLKFTPTSGSTANGSFVVQESTSNSTSGLSGPTATATITVGYAPTQAIDLSSDYNLYGITPNGAKFLGGLDGAGNAIPGSVVGTSQTWNNVPFTISSPKVDDVVQASGQTINLPNNVYQSIDLLGAAVNGNQPDVTFTVTYTDGTTQTYTQSISDWHTPQSYSGESVVVNSSYRNTQQGGTDTKAPFDVYGYSLPLNTSKAVESITLTSDSHVEILAMTVVGVSSSSSSG
ncbi:MAG TPA: hypothetical protein VMF30_07355, partial [Pirellulales bacterium]|nr:hypothetical protein [Pirellulales bacterium]